VDASNDRWWGRFAVAEGREARWRAGALELVVQHHPGEWRLGAAHHPHGADDAVSVEFDQPARDLSPSLSVTRFGVSQRHDGIELLPVMPDRPVVVRTETKLGVPPGEEVTLYLSIPVFVRVGVGSPARRLAEVPTVALPDTWFGPSTISGELGYSLRTPGRLELDAMPKRSHRAIAALRIRNLGKDLLGLERVSLPVASLNLYRRGDGSLWTDTLTMERDQDGMAAVKVSPRNTLEDGCELISSERVAGRSVLFRAFGSLFAD
jgi:hypothetical protein